MFTAYQRIVITEDIPNTNLKQGDVGMVVEVYNNGAGYEVEFFASNGDTVAVETLEAKHVREVSAREILHVRKLDAA